MRLHYRTLPVAAVLALSPLAVAPPAFAQLVPTGDLVGTTSTYTVVKGEALPDVARKNHVGLTELLAANPAIDSAHLTPGMTVTIPGQHLLPQAAHNGIVVNLAQLRLYRFLPGGQVETFPISVGREGWDTPTGTTKVTEKRKDPVWTVPDSIRAENPKLPATIDPGPKNPLGPYALNLGWPGYLIHGTNAPASVGKPSSHGCIRLYPEDITALAGITSVGDIVTVIDTPVTLGQNAGTLYLQVTPTREQAIKIVSFGDEPSLTDADAPIKALKARLATLKAQGARIDDTVVNAAIARHDGVPVAIGKAAVHQVATQSTTSHSWWDQFVDMLRNLWSRLTGGR